MASLLVSSQHDIFMKTSFFLQWKCLNTKLTYRRPAEKNLVYPFHTILHYCSLFIFRALYTFSENIQLHSFQSKSISKQLMSKPRISIVLIKPCISIYAKQTELLHGMPFYIITLREMMWKYFENLLQRVRCIKSLV